MLRDASGVFRKMEDGLSKSQQPGLKRAQTIIDLQRPAGRQFSECHGNHGQDDERGSLLRNEDEAGKELGIWVIPTIR